jgi:hypothetical protein
MSSGAAFAQSPERIHPDASGPKGGSQSERTGESDVPLPQGSRSSGTVEQGKGQANPKPDTSVSGSQSERTRETSVPLPQGSPYAGSMDMSNRQASTRHIKQAQQALKDKGHDPGPIDGVMGARTQEAIRSFQNASNLQITGALDEKTSQELGLRSGTTSMNSRENPRSNGNTTRGKDTDQPNLPPQSK